MTFTYGEDLTNDADFVRFHTGDTVDGENFLSDGIITSLLATEATKEDAVIAGLRYIIRRLSQPNFRADWLQIDNKSAREGYEKMLEDVKAIFGVGGLVGGAVYPYRADSAQTEEADYTDGRP